MVDQNVQHLEAELEEKASLVASLETEAANSKQSIVELKQSLLELQNQNNDTEGKLELVLREKSSALENVERLQKKVSGFEKEIEEMKSEMKDMEETMEVNEQKCQEIVLEKQKLEETLAEVGVECDKRGAEHGINLERIRELEAKLSSAEREKADKVQELQDEIAFV